MPTKQAALFTLPKETPQKPQTKGMERWEKTTQNYQEELENPESNTGKYYQRIEENKFGWNAYGAFEFSVNLLLLLHKNTPKHIAFVLNSSTGKDSTITCHALIQAVRQEIEEGRGWTRPIAIAIADTGSEFPEMAARMRLEAEALNKLAETWKIPLQAHIVKPPAKHRLLVEICGNGKPIPAVSTTGKTSGVSSWCMDRVKAGSLRKISQLMRELHGDYIPILGVRSAESTRRKETMGKYGDNLPHGLSRITGNGNTMTLASTPIAHWDNKAVSDFIRSFPPPWRPQGREELRAIYFKGSPTESDADYKPSECSVTISAEGQVSNSCSDLSGTRYGCWHCLLSSNKSLKNTAKREPRYLWLRRFHQYVHNKGKQAILRSDMLKKAGFIKEESFSKTFSFLERYKILMFLFRTELESGFKLLEKEEEEEINSLWNRHGIFCVTTQNAREDAALWKETGRWKAFFEDITDECHRLCNALSEGIPFGAIHGIAACKTKNPEEEKEYKLEKENEGEKSPRRKELEFTHLLAFTGQGFGTPPYPKMLAYVFEQENPNGGSPQIITALTDTPCLLGLPTNTGLLNGMSGTKWKALGIRLPLPWEKRFSQDRNFVYMVDPTRPKSTGPLKTLHPTETMEWAYQTQLLRHGCKSDDPYKDHWFDLQMIQNLNPITKEELHALFQLSAELTITSNHLTDYFQSKRNKILREINPWKETILENSEQGKIARSNIRKIVRKGLGLEEITPTMQYYAQGIRLAAKAIQTNILNTSLLLKLSYIHQMSAIDPKEAENDLQKLLKHIQIKE